MLKVVVPVGTWKFNIYNVHVHVIMAGLTVSVGSTPYLPHSHYSSTCMSLKHTHASIEYEPHQVDHGGDVSH